MNKSAFSTALLAAALLLDAIGAHSVRGEIVYSGGGALTENFDSLGTDIIFGQWSTTVGLQNAVPGATGFDGTRLGGTSPSNSSMLPSAGDLGTGAIHSFGAAAAEDRALGVLASASNIMAFGFVLRNNAPGTTVTSITISFNQENWRTPTVANNTLAAAWGTSATAGVTANNYLTAAGMTAVSSLNMTLGFTASNNALDGNLLENRVAKSFTFSSLNLALNDRLFVRWQDVDNTGNDAGIGMDDMTLTFVTAVPEAPAGALGAVAGLACAWRAMRRKKA